MNFKNLTDLFTYFKDEEICRTYLATQRWNGGVTCPHCNSERVYKTNRGFKCADKTCSKKFSVTVGTIFENSKISLRTWFAAIYLCTSSKKGVSSLQLSRQLGITQKTAWFVLHRIREMLREKAPVMLKDVVEIDESFVGGKNKNRHAHKKVPLSKGRAHVDKTPVFGAVQRNGQIIVKAVTDTKHSTAVTIINEHVEKGAIMVSDEWYTQDVFAGYNHIVIDHAIGEHARGAFDTNTIEGFWSILKRGIYGIYHQVSRKHLQRYCDEFAGRYNSRKILDNKRFELTLQNSEGRLKYKDLTAK